MIITLSPTTFLSILFYYSLVVTISFSFVGYNIIAIVVLEAFLSKVLCTYLRTYHIFLLCLMVIRMYFCGKKKLMMNCSIYLPKPQFSEHIIL